MSVRSRLVCAAVVLAALTLGACGGDEQPEQEFTQAAIVASSAVPQTAMYAGPPPVTADSEVDLAIWAIRLCAATDIVGSTANDVTSDGLDVTTLTIEARIAREQRINASVAESARSAATTLEALAAPSAGAVYQGQLVVVLRDLASRLESTQASIDVAATNADVTEAYAKLGREFSPQLAELRADAQRLEPPVQEALRATGRCAAFSGLASS